MQADLILFWVFAPISVASGIAMLLMRNAVHAALFLIVNFFCIAIFYLILGASFLFATKPASRSSSLPICPTATAILW